MKKLSVGNRVKLKSGYYCPREKNPCVNSEYECTGTIGKLRPRKESPYSVLWDNGNINVYRRDYLILISGKEVRYKNPNDGYRMLKRKKLSVSPRRKGARPSVNHKTITTGRSTDHGRFAQ